MKPEEWILSDDTGTSSMAIWAVMNGVTPRWGGTVPVDVDDFGRCVRLIISIPSYRPRLAEVAAKYPAWNRIIANWDELEKMYWQWEASGCTAQDWDTFYNRLHNLPSQPEGVYNGEGRQLYVPPRGPQRTGRWPRGWPRNIAGSPRVKNLGGQHERNL